MYYYSSEVLAVCGQRGACQETAVSVALLIKGTAIHRAGR